MHGNDGLGDTEIMKTVNGLDECINHQEHAACAIVRLAEQYKGEINIIAIGPATNLALALKLDEKLHEKVNSITIMGGTYRGDGTGNMTLQTEYNFRQDPEAIFIVLKKFKNITLVPWETCYDLNLTDEEGNDMYGNVSTPLGQFHKDSNQHIYNQFKRYEVIDTLTACIIIDPSAILSSFEAYGCIETTNSMSKG